MATFTTHRGHVITHRISTGQLARCFHRAGLALPWPFMSTHTATWPLGVDDLLELTRDGSTLDKAARAEGISPAAVDLLVESEELLRDPQVAAYAIRVQDGAATTACGLLRGERALVVLDGADEVALQQVGRADLADGLAKVVPMIRPVPMPALEVPERVLAQCQTDPAAAVSVARRAGVAEESVRQLLRLHTDTRATGRVTAFDLRSGAISGVAEWYETARGGLLKETPREGLRRFSPVDRSGVARHLGRAITHVSVA